MKKLPSIIQSVLFLILSVLLFTAHAGSNSDLAKEKRWADQIIPSMIVGEDVMLKTGEVEFLALYAEASTDKAKGAVILLHGIGVHPAWPDVIEPLRMELPDLGWHTLSLQMPVLNNEAKDTDYPPLFPEVPTRIQAGVDFLKNKGIDTIVLAGHSLGATMASYYLSTIQEPAVKAFAILSGGFGIPGEDNMDSLENFKKINNTRIVDIYGSEDRQPVLDVIKKRKELAKQLHKSRYQLIKVHGANHFYRGKENELVNALNGWLDNNMTK